jgi:hypothetical protein
MYLLHPTEPLHLIIRDGRLQLSSDLFFVVIFFSLFFSLTSHRLIEEDIDRLEPREESASLILEELVSYRDKSDNISIPIRYEYGLTLMRENSEYTRNIVAILISDRGTFEEELETSILHHSEKI